MDALAVIELFGQAWADHDLQTVMRLISADCVFDATGPAPDGSRHVGKAEIEQAWLPIFSDPTSVFTPEETFALGDRVVQLWHYSWGSGINLGHVRGIDVLRVRDGLVTEKFSYVKG